MLSCLWPTSPRLPLEGQAWVWACPWGAYGIQGMQGSQSPFPNTLPLKRLVPALGACRFPWDVKKENTHQKKILEPGCVRSVTSISLYCHLNKNI